MVKKLLKHGKYWKREANGDLVVYRAGAVVDVTPAQAKASPDQFVDLPVESSKEFSKPEVVKPAVKVEEEKTVKSAPTPSKA